MSFSPSGSRGQIADKGKGKGKDEGKGKGKEKDWNKGDTDSMTTAGLGINFYNHLGVGRRSVILPRRDAGTGFQAEYKAVADGIAEEDESIDESSGYAHTPRAQQSKETPQRQQQTPSVRPSTRSSKTGSSKDRARARDLALQTPKLLAPLQDPDWDSNNSTLDLIDRYLEHNYREQAETFVRISSRETPVRTLSAGRVVTRGTGGTDSKIGTPQLLLPSPDETDCKHNPIDSPFNQKQLQLQRRSDSQPLTSSLTLTRGTGTGTATATGSTSSPLIPVQLQPPSRIRLAISKLENNTNPSGITSAKFSPCVSLSSPSTTITTTSTSTPTFVPRSSRVVRTPINPKPTILKRASRPTSSSTSNTSTSTIRPSQVVRGPAYFTKEERQHIARLVHSSERNCDRHTNCMSCIDLEFAYHENKLLPHNMDPEQRQKIINNNRSLRNIKNELESLAEHGAISDDVYDTIMSALPAESSLGGSARSNPTPVQAPAPAPIDDPSPPAYTTPAAPSLPARALSAPPAKPEIARATALYRYDSPEDCAFEAGDQIAVHDYVNHEWATGRNLRTGREGVFPLVYVQILPSPLPPPSMYGNEKSSYNNSAYPGQPQYNQQQVAPHPGPSNPYNSNVPPMAVAEEPTKPGMAGKGQEMGKKIGKKLGNAAIFGAGATIGGNIVNSIF